MAHNPKLVYGRMTGWGQDGPLSQTAGHDINYIALAGALHAIGPTDGPPLPPLNLVGDYGGGVIYLACGLLAGILEAQKLGQGQVIDAAMLDGILYQMSLYFTLAATDSWREKRGSNQLDGGAPYYRTYETKDEKFLVIGALEQKFYDDLITRLGCQGDEMPDRFDPANWPVLTDIFEKIFKSKSQSEWCDLFDGTDTCFAPVLTLSELKNHSHINKRESVLENAGRIQPSPGPRFSRSRLGAPRSPEKKVQALPKFWRNLVIDFLRFGNPLRISAPP